MHQTTFAQKGKTDQKWFEIDVTGLPVGRVAAQVATILQGKNKPEYTPNIDTGDSIILVNCEKAIMTGRKPEQQMYRYHTLYPGGLKETSYERMLKEHPERILGYAIRRMMPKTKMGNAMMKKLHIYVGDKHAHQAQCPENLKLNVARKD